MDSGHNLSELLTALKAEIRDWVEAQLKLLQLSVFEKTAVVCSFLIYGLIIINLLFFALFFSFFALSFIIGKWINNVAAGFVIMSFFYMLILVLMLIFHKTIFTGLQNLLLKELNTEPENKSSVS